jgi:lipoate-protein ligase A
MRSEPDIFRNLALEEALARVNAKSERKVNTLRFWKSNEAVVMGRFQCPHLEVNIKFCNEHDIPIARRFTGGGTVYHDSGNLNFTLCLDQSDICVPRTLNELYWNFIGIIASSLRKIGIPARFDPNRNCIRVLGKKITGTAGWIKSGISFVHGTLLINSDLELLRNCLEVPENQPVYLRDNRRIRCIKSKRDRVVTVVNGSENPPSEEKIKQAIIKGLEEFCEDTIRTGSLTDEELLAAESLYQTRYSQEKWNMGVLTQTSS